MAQVWKFFIQNVFGKKVKLKQNNNNNKKILSNKWGNT